MGPAGVDGWGRQPGARRGGRRGAWPAGTGAGPAGAEEVGSWEHRGGGPFVLWTDVSYLDQSLRGQVFRINVWRGQDPGAQDPGREQGDDQTQRGMGSAGRK